MNAYINKLIWICLFWMPGVQLVYGQQGMVKGKVTDKAGITMPGVTVKLYKVTDTVMIGSTITDRSGVYQISNLSPDKYRLTFSFVGFAAEQLSFESAKPFVQTLGTVVMLENAKNLHEVQIKGAKNTVSISKGKLTYNVEQSATATGSSALELLRKTPGVSIDQNGSLVLKGSAAVNVMLDGKMTYLSQQQLSQMLDGMSSNNISKIEIITTPSAQFDASGNAGIINIVTRKAVKPGYAANISAGTTVGRYLLHSESFTGNIRTSKFNIFGNFGYSLRRRFLKETSTQVSTNGLGDPVILNRDGLNPNRSNFYNYRAGIDFYASAKQQFGFSYTGTIDDWSKDANGRVFVKTPAGTEPFTIVSRNVAKEPFYNNIFNLNYQYKIDTTGKILSADADYIAYRNYSDGFLNSNNYDPNGSLLEPFQQLNFHQPSIINIRSIKTDLVLPYKKISLKAGLKYADVSTDNKFRYDSLINNQLVYAPSLSDHFKYTERISAGYFSAAKKCSQTDIEAGLRVEHTYADANFIRGAQRRTYDYTSFFPSFSVGQVLNENNKLDLSVSRRINRPVYTDLNPVRYYEDKFSLYQGNPNLIAETAWLSMLSYTLRDKYIFSLSYNHSDNFIARSAVIDPVTKILTLSTANYDYRNRWEAQMIAPFSITSWWEVNTTATLSYSAYPVAQLEGPRKVQKVAIDFFAGQTYRLPGGISAELQTRYTSPELNGIYMNRYYFTMDGGAKKSFLKNKLDARFAFADLFQTGWFWGYSVSNTLNYRFKNTPDSRRFSLTLIYHLGGKLNTGKSHRTEEQNRL